MNDIMPYERIDDLGINDLRIIQDTRNFCFGIDAVLLSNFMHLKKNSTLLDLCSGTGIIPILASAKSEAMIEALEVQPQMAQMAQRSVTLNNLEDRIIITCGDLKNAGDIYKGRQFDAISCNPPYSKEGSGIKNPNDMKAISRHEILCTLEDVISVSSNLLRYGGSLFMVHRAERLVDIMFLMRKYKIEPKCLCLVHPAPKKNANLVLIEGAAHGRAFLKINEPLFLYDEDGNYNL